MENNNAVGRCEKQSQEHATISPSASTRQLGRTVLPKPVAQAVSLATRTTCLAIRASTLVGSYGFDAAKLASLSSLEIGRGIIGGILTRAGSSVTSGSKHDFSREEAESVLEASLAGLHLAMTQAVFWTATGFEMTSSTVSLVSGLSQLLLSSLDQFFGSTDSSRAIASIITLIRREFQNPSTGAQGERVGVVDLINGLGALAFLQHACRKSSEDEKRRLGFEEVVWDVVVLEDGERVDFLADARAQKVGLSRRSSHTSDKSDTTITKSLPLQSPPAQNEEAGDSDDDQLPEMCLKRQILQSLPVNTTVSISTSIKTTKTITVDVSGSGTPSLTPPPGLRVVEERDADASPSSLPAPTSHGKTYRVVYRVDRDKLKSTTLSRSEGPAIEPVVYKGVAEEAVKVPSKRMHQQPTGPGVEMIPEPRPEPRPEPGMTPQKYIPRRSLESVATRAEAASNTPQSRLPAHGVNSGHGHGHFSGANPKPQQLPLTSDGLSREQSRLPRQTPQLPAKPLPPKPQPKRSRNEKQPSGSNKMPTKKGGGLRQVLRMGSGQPLSSLWNKDMDMAAASKTTSKHPHTYTPRQPWTKPQAAKVNDRTSLVAPLAASPPVANTARRRPHELENTGVVRSPSRSSYISVHERTRDSVVSQTDTYSIHSTEDARPSTPVVVRSEVVSSNMVKSRSEKDIYDCGGGGGDGSGLSPPRPHRKVKSQQQLRQQTPSIYSIATDDSQTSLVLASYFQKSAYGDSGALSRLRRTGMVEDMFPRFHILRNITRYAKFSSASYGSSFLRYMGISKDMPMFHGPPDGARHHDVESFAHHTESHTNSILLASFVDPQGGSDSTGSTNTGVPLVHYISLDHESKAVVLACRGTLGFEDVLADMTCDYDDLAWRGKAYKVHKGIHASARRLLYGGDGKVLLTLKETLQEFDDYGLVLCGHSLGGAVTALLAVMLSEPNTGGTNFVTSAEPHARRLITSGGEAGSSDSSSLANLWLPPGRPIHVYAYGPPGTMSPSLRKATRGLITTVVQGNDLVPYLSLGVLHDFQAVALAFKNDSGSAKSDIRQRLWQAFQVRLADKWYANGAYTSTPSTFSSTLERGDLSSWALSSLQTLRAAMVYEKLLPPGEVFRIESTRVLRRDAFVRDAEDHLGRPARRLVLRYVRDVEAAFREARFGASMLIDHSPGRYEDSLNRLRAGLSEPSLYFYSS